LPNPYACPACGSSETRRVSLIYQSESYTGENVGRLKNDLGLSLGWNVNTKTQHRSDLATRLAPPIPTEGRSLQTDGLVVTMLIVVGAFCGFCAYFIFEHPSGFSESPLFLGCGLWCSLFISLLGSAAVVFTGKRSRRRALEHNQKYFFPALEKWKQTFLCGRCGKMFIPQ
jgi:hypothetical protein